MEAPSTVSSKAPPRYRPDLSVVVLTHDAKDLLRACLDSIMRLTTAASIELIVVDNRSTDGTGQMIRGEYPRVKYIYREEAFSFTESNNQGIRASSGRYILILNDDTELRNDAFDRVVRCFDSHPRCGVIGCKLLNPDLSIQYSCRRYPSFTTALFNRYSLLTKFFPANPISTNYLMTDFDHNSTIPVDWVSGACLAIRRETIDEIGLLDEQITSFTEDVDWCFRARQKGWEVVYLHDAEVIHYIGVGKSHHPLRFIWIQHRSMFYFYRKHYSKSILFIDIAVWVGVVLRALLHVAHRYTPSRKAT